MLVNCHIQEWKRVQYVCIRFCFIRTGVASCVRMAAFECVCWLIERGSLMERGKYSLIVNGRLNGTGRGLRSVSACIVVRGMIDPAPPTKRDLSTEHQEQKRIR